MNEKNKMQAQRMHVGIIVLIQMILPVGRYSIFLHHIQRQHLKCLNLL